jgi:hypothetical protein
MLFTLSIFEGQLAGFGPWKDKNPQAEARATGFNPKQFSSTKL